MYSHILVPVVFDHGERGAKSLEIARALLKESGTVTLLHVMEELPSYATTYLPEGLAQSQREAALHSLKEIAQAHSPLCKTVVIQGHAASSILDYGTAHDVDCIVIASHKPGFEDYFLGSTAARVVRHATCGVHVLR